VWTTRPYPERRPAEVVGCHFNRHVRRLVVTPHHELITDPCRQKLL
jgi:hypothetical protein